MQWLESGFIIVMTIVGIPLLYQHFFGRRRRPAVKQMRRPAVKRLSAAPRRQTVSLPTAIAYYAAYATAWWQHLRADFVKGWRAGRAVFAMSTQHEAAGETPPIAALPSVDTDTSIDTDEHTGAVADQPLDIDVIKVLHAAGWSHNKIAMRLRGSKQKRIAYIDAALAPPSIETIDTESSHDNVALAKSA